MVRTWSERLAAAAVILLLGSCDKIQQCNGNLDCIVSVLRGEVREETGYQPQSLGGTGSVKASTHVQVGPLQADGSIHVVASAQLSTDGKYTVDKVPVGLKKLIVQALDASGNVTSSAILEASGSASGEVVTATPMDSESSVEAQVMAQMVASGHVSLDEANAVDVRARINANMAAAVKAAVDAGADVNVLVSGLAEAVAAAQRTQLKAYASLGVQVTGAQLFGAQMSASVKLSAALDAGTDAKQAYADFFAGLDAGAATLGLDAKQNARAESCASAAMRATVRARLGVSASAVADASARAAGSLEARTSLIATHAILAAGLAAQTIVDAATNAGNTLRASISSAADATAEVAAYVAFTAAISGSADVSGSVIGQYLAVDVTTKTSAQTTVNVAAQASATLDTTLSTVVSTTGSIDVDAIANAVVMAYTTFATTIDAQASTLVSFGAKAQPTLDLLIVVDGSFRMRAAPMMPGPDMGTGSGCATTGCSPGNYCDASQTCQPCTVDAHCGSSCTLCTGLTPHCTGSICGP